MNDDCKSNEQCDGSRGLACTKGICNCKDTNSFYWNNEKSTCTQKSTFNQVCNKNVLCNEIAGLLCLNGVCKCEKSNLYFEGKICGKNS